MSLSVGIVGLPNVGKSTLFNALLKRQQALAANYPFATVEPNVGVVEVPDERLAKLADIVEQEKSKRPPLKPATIEFVDIAGLVAGAHKGEGLGNKFLSHIREVDLICHVLRSFKDAEVVLTGKLDPREDLMTVRMELILKDLETVTKHQDTKPKDPEEKKIRAQLLPRLIDALNSGTMASSLSYNDDELELIKSLHLLTMKPELFCLNVSEQDLANISKLKEGLESEMVVISAKVESELSTLDESDQKLYMQEVGITQSGVETLAQAAYKKLELISFLTAGEIECRAWTIKKGTTAPQAAGVIHSDFEKNFIKAKVIDWQEFVGIGGWKKARDLGKVREEGREYVMRDGDVVEFMIGR